MENNKGYTKDGSVDIHGRPVMASQTGRWKACGFLIGYEAFERMAFYGIASNLVVYLTSQLHEDTVSSVRNVSNWSGSVWLTPILGAYLADTYFGRFWTFTVSSLIYLLGMVLLTMAVSFKSLRPSCTQDGVCSRATPFQIAFFYTSLYTITIGAGGTKPNISTFGADQFDDYDAHERKLKVSFFNWWMFSSFTGGLMASLGLVYIQENLGWGLGYGIPTAGLLVSLVIFYLGTPTYRHKVPKATGPTKELGAVWATAIANRRIDPPPRSGSNDLYELDSQHYTINLKRQLCHTSTFRFLDRAAIKEGARPPCTVTQVEEAKLVLGMAFVWLATLVPSTISSQANTLFVKQGTTLNRTLGGHRFEIPAASLGSFITLSMLASIPLYDRYFVPFMRRRTGDPRGITLLQRLGVGFAVNVLVTMLAYLVELRRMRAIREHGTDGPKDVVPMSIFWLVPQYILLGIADVFSSIGLLEFFYDQSPEGMQSLGTTFFTSGIGVGNFLNSVLVTAVDKLTGSAAGGGKSWIGKNLNDSHLDYYYAFLMGLSVVNQVVFVWVATKYKYKRELLVEEKEKFVEMEQELAINSS